MNGTLMADEDFESFDNLDDLDWSDVEDELKANREQILQEAGKPAGDPMAAAMGAMGDMGMDMPTPGGGGGASQQMEHGNLEIDFLLDVQLQISVEIGRTTMLISDLLALDVNSVVELNTMVGKPLDIRINEKLIARGEVVVINDKYAVKLTEIISPDDRFATLQ